MTQVARTQGSHWRSDGRPKVSYLTEASALAAAERITSERVWKRQGSSVYQCAECGAWHVGHERGAK